MTRKCGIFLAAPGIWPAAAFIQPEDPGLRLRAMKRSESNAVEGPLSSFDKRGTKRGKLCFLFFEQPQQRRPDHIAGVVIAALRNPAFNEEVLKCSPRLTRCFSP
jgi:hypothetical protein